MPTFVGTPVSAGAAPQTSPLNYSYTVPTTGARRCLIVAVMAFDAGSITGVTYAGVAMTSIGSIGTPSGDGIIQLFRLVAPATGANTVSVTLSQTFDECWSHAFSYEDVNQTTPTGTIQTIAGGTRTTTTIPTMSLGANDVAIGAFYGGVGVITLTESDTLILENDASGVSTRGTQRGDANLSWTHSSSFTEAIGVPIIHDAGVTVSVGEMMAAAVVVTPRLDRSFKVAASGMTPPDLINN